MDGAAGGDDDALGPLTHDRLTRDVWLWQRAKGHRFSSDDLVTALLATRAEPDAAHALDLGCGIGTVLLHVAWSLPGVRAVGVEAQAGSFALLRRNVDESGLAARVQIVHGDLREPAVQAQVRAHAPDAGRFPLITGTPPYFPPGHAVDAKDGQRAYARIEYRGGVEAYAAAAAALLAPGGTFVMCGAAGVDERVRAGAAAAGLHVTARCDVIGRAGQAPLFAVWTLRHAATTLALSTMTLRDAAGVPTEDAAALRRFAGLA
jgi:tRNA1Val (adenine37-N6)-methyltransferase